MEKIWNWERRQCGAYRAVSSKIPNCSDLSCSPNARLPRSGSPSLTAPSSVFLCDNMEMQFDMKDLFCSTTKSGPAEKGEKGQYCCDKDFNLDSDTWSAPGFRCKRKEPSKRAFCWWYTSIKSENVEWIRISSTEFSVPCSVIWKFHDAVQFVAGNISDISLALMKRLQLRADCGNSNTFSNARAFMRQVDGKSISKMKTNHRA